MVPQTSNTVNKPDKYDLIVNNIHKPNISISYHFRYILYILFKHIFPRAVEGTNNGGRPMVQCFVQRYGHLIINIEKYYIRTVNFNIVFVL